MFQKPFIFWLHFSIFVFFCFFVDCLAQESTNTQLPLSSISSAGEEINSDSTLLSLSEFGSNFHHITESTNTEERSGYVEQVNLYLGTEKPPQEGTLTVEGKVLDYSSVTVIVRTYKVKDQEETLLSECSASVTGNEPGNYEKTFTADCLNIIETQAGEYIKIEVEATDYFGRKSSASIKVNVDLTSPSRPTLNPWPPEYTDISPYPLSGTKPPNTSVWINGLEVVPLTPETTWSYNYPFSEGSNLLTIIAKDEAQNPSGAITANILLDQLAPQVNITSPLDGYLTNQTSIEVKGTLSNDVDKTLNPACGVWVQGIEANIDRETWTFSVSVPLDIEAPEPNIISATALSVKGHTATSLPISVLRDTTPPQAPQTNPVISPTGEATQLITGTKEEDTSVWLQDQEIYALDSEITWSWTAVLTHGLNTFQFSSKDKAGNIGELSEPVEIFYDSTPPLFVSISDDGDYTTDLTQLHVTYQFREEEEDAGISISEYLVAVGTIPGAEDIRPFESVGLETSPTITGLNLVQGTKYYITVKAKNSVGLESQPYSTDGIFANQSLPTILVDTLIPENFSRWYEEDQIPFYAESTDDDGDTLEYQFEAIDSKTQEQVFFRDFSPDNFAIWTTEQGDAGVKWLYVRVRDPYGAKNEYGGGEGDDVWKILILHSSLASPRAR